MHVQIALVPAAALGNGSRLRVQRFRKDNSRCVMCGHTLTDVGHTEYEAPFAWLDQPRRECRRRIHIRNSKGALVTTGPSTQTMSIEKADVDGSLALASIIGEVNR